MKIGYLFKSIEMTQQEFIDKWVSKIHAFDMSEFISDLESLKSDPNNEFWVARDRNGDLWYYKEKPRRGVLCWELNDSNFNYSQELPKTMFSNLKWEDEPIKVRLEVIQ